MQLKAETVKMHIDKAVRKQTILTLMMTDSLLLHMGTGSAAHPFFTSLSFFSQYMSDIAARRLNSVATHLAGGAQPTAASFERRKYHRPLEDIFLSQSG